MSASIFERATDGRYVGTEAALSPWSDQALHGSPTAMLLAREIERVPADQDMFVTRMTVTLSCDHRVVDGALGAQLLGAFKAVMEAPAAMLI